MPRVLLERCDDELADDGRHPLSHERHSVTTRRVLRFALVTVCLSASHSIATAQNPSRGGAIVVTVKDTSAGSATRPIYVTGSVPMTPGDRSMYRGLLAREISAGRFRIDSLPADSVSIQVSCATVRPGSANAAKASLLFFVHSGESIDTTVVVNHTGCDPRPLRSERRVFTGLYTPGFESSDFLPCANDTWILSSDSLTWLPFKPHAWVTWGDYRKVDGVSFPSGAMRDSYGNPTYFMCWRGIMKGPGSYGHMGVSQFDFAVDSILAIAIEAPAGCTTGRDPR